MKAAHTSVIICLLAGLQQGTTWQQGYAAHYDVGVMEQVARNRGMSFEECMVATPNGPLGSWVRVGSLLTNDWETCRITDMAAPPDRDRIVANGIVVEISANQIWDLCNLTYVNQSPPRECPVLVEYLP